MKKKPILITIFFSILSLGIFIGICCESQTDYARMYVSFGRFNTPCVEIEIEGVPYALELNLSSITPLSLNTSVLTHLQKTPHSELTSKNLDGVQKKSHAYLLPKIQMGNLTYTDVLVDEVEEQLIPNQEVGIIGRPLLTKTNLLFDLPNSTVIACNSKERLKKAGYILDDMIQVPFKMNSTGIIIPISTDFGTIPFGISTGCTFSLIRASLTKDKEIKEDDFGRHCISALFAIDSKNFANQPLHLYNMGSSIREIEGILGIDFFTNHVVYFDFSKKLVYIGDSIF